MKSLYTPIKIRNPFKIKSLPLGTDLYRLRKGNFSRKKGILIKLIPGGGFLKFLFKVLNYRKGVFTFQGREISFNPNNTQFHSIYFPEYELGYEVETLSLIDFLIDQNPNLNFYDIGSNWGHFSLFVSSHPNYNGHIKAFEPGRRTYADLCDVVAGGGLGKRIECINIGLSDEKGSAFLDLPDGLHSGMAKVNSSKGDHIKLDTLDSFFSNSSSLLKVDVEGLEYQVFKGGLKSLREYKPFIIFESWSDLEDTTKVLNPFKILKNLGYHFFEPALLDQVSEIPSLFGYTHNVDMKEEGILGLVEFELEQRFLLKDQLNVFCCHDDHYDEFIKKFKDIESL